MPPDRLRYSPMAFHHIRYHHLIRHPQSHTLPLGGPVQAPFFCGMLEQTFQHQCWALKSQLANRRMKQFFLLDFLVSRKYPVEQLLMDSHWLIARLQSCCFHSAVVQRVFAVRHVLAEQASSALLSMSLFDSHGDPYLPQPRQFHGARVHVACNLLSQLLRHLQHRPLVCLVLPKSLLVSFHACLQCLCQVLLDPA